MVRRTPLGSVVEKRYAVNEWLKPGSVEDRLYQERILEAARRRSTLIVLPTALGKTVIALLLAVEKARHGRVFFLAPTRPLVEQHHRTFCDKTLIEEQGLVLVTGKSPPAQRRALYRNAKVVFATPQCVWNDLKSQALSLADASLIIFDEAHRARGDYAYVGIALHYLRQCPKPLVLGLTASPGGYEEKIVEVCRNLGIEAIEYRTDEDEDVKPYIQPIEMEWRRVKPPEAYLQVREKLRQMLIERVNSLRSLGVLSGKEPAFVTRRDLVELNEELQRRLGAGEGGYLYQLKVQATATLSLSHMVELIETQGPETLQAFIEGSLSRMAQEGSRGHKSILDDPLFEEVRRSLAASLSVENPKVQELMRTLSEQLEVNPASRMIVFTQYRDTVKAILRRLEGAASIRAARFVGQGFKEGDPGMSQEQQREALERLRGGELNVLVATSIAEEGLDIPEVDLVFYEPVPSEIRYIQRRGRTGRRVAGKVTVLIAEGTLDEAFYWSSMTRAKRMRRLIRELNRKLPQMLREAKPTLTLPVAPRLAERRLGPVTQVAVRDAAVGPTVPAAERLWAPQAVQTKGSGQALKWLMENLPGEETPIEELIRRGVEETGLEQAAVETAIWRLAQQGLLYQPQPGKVRRP
ncbi:MAG: helicase-related protein [Candidatus Bathyarchaeia archaeon]